MTSMMRIRHEIESEITQNLLQIVKTVMGRGPQDARTYLLDLLVLVRCKIPLTPPERALLTTGAVEQLVSIRDWRRKINDSICDQMKPIVENILNSKVISTFSDACPISEETVLLLTIEQNASEKNAPKKENATVE